MKSTSISFETWIFILAACISSISCTFIPKATYVPPYKGGGWIDISVVKPGITTKEEVFLQFGNAFAVSEDEKLFTARYSLDGYFAWGFGSRWHEKTLTSVYDVEIEFDENDVVKRCESFKWPREQSQEKK